MNEEEVKSMVMKEMKFEIGTEILNNLKSKENEKKIKKYI